MKYGSWLNAPSGLIRRNFSKKPAYEKLKDVIYREWGFQKQDIISDTRGNLKIHSSEGQCKIFYPYNKEKSIIPKKNRKGIQISSM